MELELKKERFACYRALPQLCSVHEETTETIVPDYLPDIARVVDSGGCLFLRSHSLADGRISVSGQVRMTLLYMADDAQGLRAFVYTMPLELTMDGRIADGAVESCLEGRLCACDVRPVNPRKLFTRVNIQLTLTPYASCMLTVCSGVEEQERYGIETLCEQREVPMIRALREKEFSFSDELLLSNAKAPIRELLSTKCTLRLTDQRLIGNKLAVKGLALLDILYLDTDGTPARAGGELPFSQVLDGIGDEAVGEVNMRATLHLTGMEARIGSESEPDNARVIALHLSLAAFAVLSETRSIHCISDLYSTSWQLNAKMESTELSGEPELFTREQLVREKLETGAEVKSVLLSEVRFGSTGLVISGRESELNAAADLRVLYLDENGTPLLAERRVDIRLQTELPEGQDIRVQTVATGELTATIGADGIELRFPVIFTLGASHTPCWVSLTGLQAEAPANAEEHTPSLILRAMKPGERLWDVAKQYRATVSAIISANELADDSAPDGRLLLIPRSR